MIFRIASVLGLLAMIAGILALLWLRSLFHLFFLVILLQAAAALLIIWARLLFGWRSFHFAANPTRGGLVTTGPYHFIRHPIYAAVCLFVWAGALGSLSLLSFLSALLTTLGAVIRVFCEERLLAEGYPEYLEYAARTKRMIPYLF
jgi:protein-S-isoprenylcysteine O-methyltransferase Ste14